MTEKQDLPFDPDATLGGPLAGPDPDATISGPLFDPDQTVGAKAPPADPDATFTGPKALFDPDATVEKAPAMRRRANPYAPKALPEALRVNLAVLGGLNSLVAFANPIFGVLPEIRTAKTHPDPALLKETLQDLSEAFEAGASAAGVTEESLEAAVYALCCLADDSVAATPWGADWMETGLLQTLCGETGGGQEFFVLLEATSKNPQGKQDLLEFLYVCLALGFEGRYRDRVAYPRGREELDEVRAKLHALVAAHRPRPANGLSQRWRGVSTPPPQPLPGVRLPWDALGGAVLALLVLFAGYEAVKAPVPVPAPVPVVVTVPAPVPPPGPAKTEVAPQASSSTPAQPLAEAKSAEAKPAEARPAPAVPTLQQQLAAEVQRGLITLTEDAQGTRIAIRHDRQFGLSDVEPTAEVQAIIERIAAALDGVPGAILVTGHADSVLVIPRPRFYASNHALSVARAEAVARLMAAKLSQPQRLKSAGAAESEPLVANATEPDRAKNRRVDIHIATKATP